MESFGIKVVGKIDLKKIPKSSKPVKSFDVYPRLPKNRDELDNGWSFTFIIMQRNYYRYILSK
jgi:hypothetical protein